MKSTLLFLAAATTISALPQGSATDLSVQVCTGENYIGDCKTLYVAPDTCQQLPGLFRKNIGSFKPGPKTLCRITYTADTCTMHGDAFVDPEGVATLHTDFTDPATGEEEDVGNLMTSFLCQPCSTCN